MQIIIFYIKTINEENEFRNGKRGVSVLCKSTRNTNTHWLSFEFLFCTVCTVTYAFVKHLLTFTGVWMNDTPLHTKYIRLIRLYITFQNTTFIPDDTQVVSRVTHPYHHGCSSISS